MKVLTCAAAFRSLQAFHDGELQVSAQIAVSSPRGPLQPLRRRAG